MTAVFWVYVVVTVLLVFLGTWNNRNFRDTDNSVMVCILGTVIFLMWPLWMPFVVHRGFKHRGHSG